MQATDTQPAQAPQPPTLERLYELSPTANKASRAKIAALYSHPSAPRWNHPAGDRLTHDDVAQLAAFASEFADARGVRTTHPGERILAWAQSRIAATPLFRGRVAEGFDLDSRWTELPTSFPPSCRAA